MDGLLHHLNNIHPTIKFTMEVEEGGSLPFLNTKVSRREDGKLDITVYCKQTHTDRCLHFRSHRPTREEGYGEVSLQLHQVPCVAETEPGERGEPPHESLRGNSYPHSFICSASAFSPPRKHDGEREEEKPPTVHLTYVAGVCERIKRVCRDLNISQRPPPYREASKRRL